MTVAVPGAVATGPGPKQRGSRTCRSAVVSRLTELDTATLVGVQSLAHVTGARRGALVLSGLGEHAAAWLVVGALGAALDPARRGPWLRATTAVLGAHAVSVVLKRIVRRHRPTDPRVQVLGPTAGRWSFPSAHAASTAAAGVAYSAVLGRRSALLPVPAMMASRVLLGVHYPGDVLAGAAIGAAVGHWLPRSRRVWGL